MTEPTDGYKEQISQLRSDLNQVVEEKKALVRSHRELVTGIKGKIVEIKQFKERRDRCTNAVKDLKVRRTDLHNAIKEKVSKLHDFRTEIESKDSKPRLPVGMLKAEIRKLEMRIETGAISFEEEKKLMKVIKDKQKQMKGSEKFETSHEDERSLVNEIRLARQESDDVHKALQENAKESQVNHEKILVLSKEIDDQRAKEKEMNDKLDELTKKLDDVNTVLQELLSKYGQARDVEEVHYDEVRQEKKARDRKILDEKERIAEDKLKKGLKLTTQDLLALQGKAMMEEGNHA